MSAASPIEWTDATWNPLRGCSRISEGCRHCYAERVATRFAGAGQPYAGLVRGTPRGPRWSGQLRLIEDRLRDPLHWRRPRRIFVNSMSDLFHEAAPTGWRHQIFAVMAAAPRHRFQALTKRAGRMAEYLLCPGTPAAIEEEMARLELGPLPGWPLTHVWLGFSAETQPHFDERSGACQELSLRGWPLFASLEPLLAPIDPRAVLSRVARSDWEQFTAGPATRERVERIDPRYALRWLIVGGESGDCARPCAVPWIRDIVRACDELAVPCFVKQLGAEPLGDDLAPLTLAGRKGNDPACWPADLRVRQFPLGLTLT